MHFIGRLLFAGWLMMLFVTSTLAFCPQPSSIRQSSRIPSQSTLYFFNRNKKDEDNEDGDEDEKENKPFFARMMDLAKQSASPGSKPKEPEAADGKTSDTKPAASESSKSEPVAPVSKKGPSPAKKEELSPAEKAQSLKAQAERMRLEAERMDAQLTLDKIDRLERELAQAKKKGDSVDDLQAEMEALQAKLRGEAPKAVVKTATAKQPEETITVSAYTPPKTIIEEVETQPVDKEKFQQNLKNYENAPEAMKGLMAGTVGMYSPDVKDLNATEVALRMEMLERSDYSFLKDVPEPSFSAEEIEKVKKNPLFRIRMMAEKEPESAVAIKLLKDQYYTEILSRQLEEQMEEAPFFEIEIQNMTDLDRMTESLFPKACRKEGETPTMPQAMKLVTDVLPKAGFNPSGKPEPVEGGYIIRGTNKKDSADALVESIDASLAKSSISGELSVFFIKDYTVFTEEQLESPDFNPLEPDPILLVTGPNVYREPRRFLYSAVSAMGIGTSWYLSIYPFLLNPDLMKRAEEQMTLADANMAYDLTWLTDLSLPLFLTFMGVQLTHELGHRVAAAAYGMNITVPTFVPSLITGMTSTVTTFKEPPKNREAMFDFSIAGPLAGIAASLVAMYLGLEFTVFSTADAYAQYPALPLEILRQSTLGGGLVEAILGRGALGVPGGAEGTSAISSINIPLHPVAIAGYIGLIVNSLALLPIGTTDGGRIAMTLFSRGAKIVVSQLFLVVLFVFGLFGSDLFLFYFSFLIFFQQGNEIPARNEVDEISFSRVLVATFAGVISLLALIPIS